MFDSRTLFIFHAAIYRTLGRERSIALFGMSRAIRLLRCAGTLALEPQHGSKFKNFPYITGFARFLTSIFTNQATLTRFENSRNVEMTGGTALPRLRNAG